MSVLWIIWLGAAVLMLWGWSWQRRHSNIGVVDVLWALGVGISSVVVAGCGPGGTAPRALLAVLGAAWSLRLAWHLAQRVRREPEDGRYRHLREHWRGHQGRIFGFFQFQALLVVLFSVPFVAAAANPHDGFRPWWIAAIATWLLSVGGETLADRQLAQFRSNPANRGRTCREGLWRYSRHPNYFFEWLHWFTYVFLAIGSPLSGWALTGPVVMYVFLRWVSGIPYTEQQALRSRGDDYRRYQRTTPRLFPWFPSTDEADEGSFR